MSQLAIKIGWALLSKLLTEAFVSKTVVYGLSSIAKNTTNQLDDKMVKAVADALGVVQ